MSEEKTVAPEDAADVEKIQPRPPVGTYNPYEDQLLTVLHFIKYNLHLNAKATVLAALLNTQVCKTTEEATELTTQLINAMRKQDGV